MSSSGRGRRNHVKESEEGNEISILKSWDLTQCNIEMYFDGYNLQNDIGID